MHLRSTKLKNVENITQINSNIDNAVIRKVSNTTFLGIIVDENLTWKAHIDNLTKKLSTAVQLES